MPLGSLTFDGKNFHIWKKRQCDNNEGVPLFMITNALKAQHDCKPLGKVSRHFKVPKWDLKYSGKAFRSVS